MLTGGPRGMRRHRENVSLRDLDASFALSAANGCERGADVHPTPRLGLNDDPAGSDIKPVFRAVARPAGQSRAWRQLSVRPLRSASLSLSQTGFDKQSNDAQWRRAEISGQENGLRLPMVRWRAQATASRRPHGTAGGLIWGSRALTLRS